MPLARREHRGDALLAYRWGLLPDNEVILDAPVLATSTRKMSPLSAAPHEYGPVGAIDSLDHVPVMRRFSSDSAGEIAPLAAVHKSNMLRAWCVVKK
jgi:hypothetical protein